MEQFRQVAEAIAGVLVVSAYFPYILAIFRRETEPSRSTWIIWTSQSLLTAAGMFMAGTLNVQIAVVAFGDVVTLLLALRFGESKWEKLDVVLLVVAGIGTVEWLSTSDPIVAVVTGLGVTSAGSIATIEKLWRKPRSEDWVAYSFMVLSCVFQIAATRSWTIVGAAQPIVFLLNAGPILAVILFRPRFTCR